MGEPPFGTRYAGRQLLYFTFDKGRCCVDIFHDSADWRPWNWCPRQVVVQSHTAYCILVHCICQQQKVTSARLCFAVTWGFYTYSYSNIEKLRGGGLFFQRTNLNSTSRIFRLLVPPAGLCPGDPGQMSRSLHVPRDYYLQSAPGIISGTRRFNFVGWKKIMEDCCPSIVTWGTNISLFISCKSIIT